MRKRDHMQPESPMYRMRHSFAHVLAQAVLELRPGARLGYGPPTDNGFFYDFDLEPPLTPEDLPDLEKRMKKIIAANQPFTHADYEAGELIGRYKQEGMTYKAEMAEGFAAEGEKTLSVYKIGDFEDMCEGHHVESTGKLPADGFKLDSLAGAYWRGDQENPMMQRVYGLAFKNGKELKEFLALRELARERDHRKLGQQMQLFTISEEVGKGLPLWLPNGTVLREELEKLAKETEFRWGYKRVATPHITKEGLYHTSGHLPYYAADMFPPMESDDGRFYLKPMNCPHHHMIFKAVPRSYRDLPLRLAEYGQCYRYEQSGELSGLLRVRGMCMNDAHIYCTEDQATQEFIDVIRMHQYFYGLFGISDYWIRLSLPDLDSSDKYVGERSTWEKAEETVVSAMREVGVDYEAEKGEAAFYGPKIDFQITNVVGREETASTNQLDLIMAERFDLSYVGADNRSYRPHILHRAPLGTHERFIAFLVEHYGGVFPTWMAPEQVRVIPVAEPFLDYARKLAAELRDNMVRAEVDSSSETLGKKIRDGQTAKVPNLFVVGQQEQDNQAVAWRRHGKPAAGQPNQVVLPFAQAQEELLREIRERRDWRRED
ncbi:MAG: threonine--tRNA ligase [Deltaproteobacteria bacterium]|nr:threonine--tRNA ligase [Deltaproteobacteria bacterium]